ncbi:hypothetical protein BH11VER1_BH11VER1_36130 [soil metagenome]
MGDKFSSNVSILYHLYTLYSHGSLNAVSTRREFRGALIKVNSGIGCLHPWPEFGDPSVNEQLDLLRIGGTSKVIERAFHMAEVDGAARRRGVSLFAGLEIPRCHYSWDSHEDAAAQMQRVVNQGWQAVKTKGWGNVPEVLKYLEALCSSTFQCRDLHANSTSECRATKLRIDFNSCLTEARFIEFLTGMSDPVRAMLDFVEDPFPYDAQRWAHVQETYGVRLALDKQLRGANAGFDVAVLKPGRRDWREMVDGLPSDVRIVMTSAMDHAIGQSFAAYEAAMAWRELGDRMDLCGLATNHLFAPDAFFERLSAHGGKLEVDRSGTGLGFDDELQKLPWVKL